MIVNLMIGKFILYFRKYFKNNRVYRFRDFLEYIWGYINWGIYFLNNQKILIREKYSCFVIILLHPFKMLSILDFIVVNMII